MSGQCDSTDCWCRLGPRIIHSTGVVWTVVPAEPDVRAVTLSDERLARSTWWRYAYVEMRPDSRWLGQDDRDDACRELHGIVSARDDSEAEHLVVWWGVLDGDPASFVREYRRRYAELDAL